MLKMFHYKTEPLNNGTDRFRLTVALNSSLEAYAPPQHSELDNSLWKTVLGIPEHSAAP